MTNTTLRQQLLGLLAFTLSLNSLPPLAAQAAAKPTKVTFFCELLSDPANHSQLKVPQNETDVPVTVVWIPERKAYIRLIAWKSDYFAAIGKDPFTRCQEVTQKFQQKYDNDELDYLASSQVSGYPVICGLSDEQKAAAENIENVCTADNLLLTLKPHDRPDQMLRELVDIFEGKASDTIYHNSAKDKLFIWVKDIFRTRKPSESEGPKKTATGGSKATPDSIIPRGQEPDNRL